MAYINNNIVTIVKIEIAGLIFEQLWKLLFGYTEGPKLLLPFVGKNFQIIVY